jgi:repressor LexA
MPQLTKKQQKLFQFIERSIKKEGHSPTHSEIQENFGFKSKGTVQDYISALESKGVLKRNNGWNGLELVTKPNMLPLLGKVAAGQPIEHLNVDEEIEVPSDMISGSGNYFALQVRGDSMINDGILENDFVIVKQQKDAANGQIIVARIGNEATIKRIYKRKSHIELHSANEKYQPKIIQSSQDFQILGIYCGLIRKN